MLSVVKTVVLSAGNAEEIAIDSKKAYFFVNVFHCGHMPSAVAGKLRAYIYVCPSRQES